MADLFGYTATQNIVAPSSPTIEIRPNMQAANAFKTLQETINTGLKAASDVQAAEMSLARTQAQIETANTAAAKEAKKAQDAAEAIRIKQEATGLYTALEANLAEAGADVNLQGQHVQGFLAGLDDLTKDANIEVLGKVDDSFNGFRRDIASRFSKTVRDYNINNAKSNTAATIPSFVSESEAGKKQSYKDMQDMAFAAGIPKRDFGEFFVKSLNNYVTSRLDPEALANNYDYAQLDSMSNTIEQLANIDPFLNIEGGELNAARSKIVTLKNGIDSAVKANIELAISESDSAKFNELLKIGLDNGAFNADWANLKQKDYASTLLSSGKIAEAQAQTIIGSGKTVPLALITDSKVSNLVKAAYTADIVKQLNGAEAPNAGYLKEQAAQNADLFGGLFKEAFNRNLNTALNALTEPAKTPEEQAQQRQTLFQTIQRANELSLVGGSAFTNKMRTKLAVVKTLMMNDKIKNIPDAMQAMENLDEFTVIPTSNSNVQKLRDDISMDQQNEAVRVFSALVRSGQATEDEAFDLVSNQYKYQQIDGLDFKVSGKVLEDFQKLGLNEEAVGYFQRVLMQDGTLSTEERSQIEAVLNGTNPIMRTQMNGGGFYFKNDEGSTYNFMLTQDQMKKLTSATADTFRMDNKAIGVQAMVDDAMQVVAEDASKAWDMIEGFTVGAASPYMLAGRMIMPDWGAVGETISEDMSNINQLIHNIYTDEMTNDEAWAIYDKANTARLDKLDARFQEGERKAWEDFRKRSDRLMEEMRALPFDEAAQFLGDRLQETVKLFISPAEASGIAETPDEANLLNMLADREAPKLKGVPNLTEGAIHQGQEGKDSPTTNYGVRIDLHPKLENETDREHALRVYNTEFKPFVDSLNVKGVDKATLGIMAWNMGATKNSPLRYLSGLDMSRQDHQIKAFDTVMKVIHTQEGTVWSKGLLNARMNDWNNMAKGFNPNMMIDSYRAVKDSDGQTFFFYKMKDGTYQTSLSNKPLSADNTMVYNKDIKVQ